MPRPRLLLLGRNIRGLRLWWDWSEARLARQAGVPPSLVRRIERDQADPRLSQLIALASALKVDVLMLVDPPTKLMYVDKGERELFWSQVTKVASGKCWSWRGGKDRKTGRPKFRLGDQVVQAARVAYAITAPLPAHWTVDHDCKNGSCVNPSHLKAMSVGRNLYERDRRRSDRELRRLLAQLEKQ